jgi:hypothetical protein
MGVSCWLFNAFLSTWISFHTPASKLNPAKNLSAFSFFNGSYTDGSISSAEAQGAMAFLLGFEGIF